MISIYYIFNKQYSPLFKQMICENLKIKIKDFL